MKNRNLIGFFLLLLLLGSCAKVTEEKRAKIAQDLYSEGMAAYASRDYGKAIERLKEALRYLENLTPSQIKDAKYAIADSYYMKKDYVNAVVYLEDFVASYPGLPETERAFYQLVDSYMKVAPDAYRDQSYTLKALDKAREFLSKYPSSPYADKVSDLIQQAVEKLAKHQYLIARFYEDYGYYYSAALRYRDLLINYPEQISDAEVSYRYIRSLLLVRKQADKRKEYYQGLIEDAYKSLAAARSEDEKRAIEKRINFLKSQVERWERIADESYKEGIKALQKYREVYGENNYYKELEKLSRR